MSTGDVHSSPVDLTRAPPEISILIEMEKSKREKRKLIRKKDISSVMEKKINKREIDIPKSLNNKKVLKVNVIDDEQIKFIKKLKRK